MKRKSLNPEGLFDSRQYGFSQVVIAEPGNHVFISGQVAWDNKLKVIGRNDLAIQAQKSMDNLRIAIEAAGGTLDNIVSVRIYVVDYTAGDDPIISKVLKDNFGTHNPPTSTWINVKGLANEEFMIEIEAQAII